MFLEEVGEMSHFFKPQPCVKRPAGNILGVDPTYQHMLAQARCPGNEFVHQLTTNPLPPAVGPDMHGMLDRMLVARPSPEFAK